MAVKRQALDSKQDIPVAIIGMGCFFPKSSGLKDYWRLIFHGEDAISQVPSTHWSPEDYFDEDIKRPDHTYCKRGGFLAPIMFDPTEFGIPPNTLEATDTSQLLGLVAAKLALKDAGYDNGKPFNRDRTSVILGVTGTQELVIPLSSRLGFPKWRRALEAAGVSAAVTENVMTRISQSYVPWQENSFPGLLGNVVAGRICNRLDLGGTNCVVDAACASSMSAIHLALLELYTGRSDMVVTGGVDTLNDIFMHMCFSKTHILSPTGDARPFSKDADGTVIGEGIGILIFKRLKDAEYDGDRIYAVIRGIGSSSDGKSQSIYAPRVEGQAKALQMAYQKAGVDPLTVGLVEAHGTGTRVGDRVEFNALRQVFESEKRNGHKCALGSVKSMIGHTKAAAGAAGLIKTALSLHHKILPPTLKADQPDPQLGIVDSPFYISTRTRPWFTDSGQPRRCGVSSFGFGGSNFHVVLEEYKPDKYEVAWDGSVEIVALSATSKNDLQSKLLEFQRLADGQAAINAFSAAAAQSRQEFSHQNPYRLLAVFDHQQINSGRAADRLQQLAELLKQPDHRFENQRGLHYGTGPQPGKLAFLFPGQGSQYPGMGRDLVCCFPEAFKSIAAADIAFGRSGHLSEHIYPLPPKSPQEEQIQAEKLRSTDIAQPAIGAVSLAMLKILSYFGITPQATGGHSFGEITALHAAGCLDEDAFFKLAVNRGRLMAGIGGRNGLDSGGMLAVNAPLTDIEKVIKKHRLDVVLANRNSPEQGVVSGSQAAVAEAEKCFQRQNLKTVRLPVSAAFHSRLVQDARAPFADVLKQIRFTPAQIPVFSNTTAEPYPADTDIAAEMLADHLLQPVNFTGEIENLYRADVRTFIEVGPKSILCGLVSSILRDKEIRALAIDSSAGKRFGILDLADALCRLAAAGYPVALDRWENAGSDNHQPKMQIPLSGANYTGKQQPEKSADVPEKRPKFQPPNEKSSKLKTVSPTANMITTDPVRSNGNSKEMKKENQNQRQQDFINQALQAVQQGLASMQSLQKQTSDAHQKFLETQQENSRTLQHMMESTRRLAEVSLGLAPGVQRAEFIAEENLAPVAPRPLESVPEPADKPEPNTASSFAIRHEAVSPRMDTGADDHEDFPPAEGQLQMIPAKQMPTIIEEKLRSGILEVVSELTGYPQEMIDMDMDIEADLGIDSIKRVEILSTLEEKIPALPSISPEVMGKLKTLRQISVLFMDAIQGEETIVPKLPPKTDPSVGEAADRTQSRADESQALETALLSVVSDLTGYPPEMIEMDMDIEADLGIDSIKRVEILSTLEEKMPDLPSVSPEVMGGLKTLRQIAAFLGDTVDADAGNTVSAAAGPAETASANKETDAAATATCCPITANLERRRIRVVTKPLDKVERISLPAGRKVFITDDQTGLSEAIMEELTALGINTVLISPDILNYKDHLPPAAGLVLVQNPNNSVQSSDLKQVFGLTRHIARTLADGTADQEAVFGVVSRLDGAFGFMGKGLAHPLQGALAGLVKTAALEWESVRCRAIDVAPTWQDHPAIAKAVVDELLNADPGAPVEIGLNADGRYVLQLEPAAISREDPVANRLQPEDVIVVSGGARGVTAAAACALAAEMPLTLILLGRSPNPVPVPSWLEDLEDAGAVKKAILNNEFGGQNPSPKALEAVYKRHMANREISRTLDNIASVGSRAHYYSIDIRDKQAVDATLDRIRAKFGPIKGIIHGAGVLEDRLIIDKTEEQFSRVFETKVMGLIALLAATEKDPLQHLVIFSSITARLGNRGQADYAMANEALNKIAQQIAAQSQQLQVVSINWGPWDGGMVDPALKKEFQRKGVALIPVELGAKHMVREMLCADHGGIEVVVGSRPGHADATQMATSQAAASIEAEVTSLPEATPRKDLSLTFKRRVDVQRFPILRSHVLNGKAVVPLALMAEWFGHGALHENPGLHLHGLDDMRVLTGIKLDDETRQIRLLASKTLKKGRSFEVSLELRDGFQGNIEVVHSRAKAILVDAPIQPPDYNMPENLAVRNYTRPIAEVYDKILFHGSELHGIREISHCSSKGIVAQISSAPAPARWMQEPLRNKWLSDPLVLDSAFQMATIWCHEKQGAVSLPSYCAAYRQYCDRFPEAGVTAVLEIKEATAYKVTGDFTFLDSANTVVARITGYEAIIDPALYKAFKPQHAA